jgi:hypothetical protein
MISLEDLKGPHKLLESTQSVQLPLEFYHHFYLVTFVIKDIKTPQITANSTILYYQDAKQVLVFYMLSLCQLDLLAAPSQGGHSNKYALYYCLFLLTTEKRKNFFFFFRCP